MRVFSGTAVPCFAPLCKFQNSGCVVLAANGHAGALHGRAMSTGLIGLTTEEEALLVQLREAEGLTGISHDQASLAAEPEALLEQQLREAEGLMGISDGQAFSRRPSCAAAEPPEPGVQHSQQLGDLPDDEAAAVAFVARRLSAASAHVAATEEQLVVAEKLVATVVAKAEASSKVAPDPAWRPSQRINAVVTGLRERRQLAEAEMELQRTVEGALLERATTDRQAELQAAMCRWTAAVVWRVRARLGAALLSRLAVGAADTRRRSLLAASLRGWRAAQEVRRGWSLHCNLMRVELLLRLGRHSALALQLAPQQARQPQPQP